jgi:hypothetical protein
MSSMLNKIKDAVTPDKHSSAPEGTHGPHESRAANAADPRVDSDRDHRAAPGSTGHTLGTSDHYTNTTSGNYGLSSDGPAPSTAGPHKSDMMNRMDPRVDSDRDNSRTLGGNTKTGTNVPEGTDGPHGSRMANILDPRVDSDRDRTVGMGSHSGTTGTTGTTGHTLGSTGNTLGSTGNTFGTSGTSEGVHGPHSSRLANAADPRVDSDRDHRAAPGSTFGTSGTSEGVHGPHGSRLANAADPRVDSDRDHRGAHHTGATGTSTGDNITGHAAAAVGGVAATGPAPHTAGPHKSDFLNKIDPRVDSDLDGSKTFPGNKTFAQS